MCNTAKTAKTATKSNVNDRYPIQFQKLDSIMTPARQPNLFNRAVYANTMAAVGYAG